MLPSTWWNNHWWPKCTISSSGLWKWANDIHSNTLHWPGHNGSKLHWSTSFDQRFPGITVGSDCTTAPHPSSTWASRNATWSSQVSSLPPCDHQQVSCVHQSRLCAQGRLAKPIATFCVLRHPVHFPIFCIRHHLLKWAVFVGSTAFDAWKLQILEISQECSSFVIIP